MPKIINQTYTTLDSLNSVKFDALTAKINTLDSQFNVIRKSHILLQDSLKTLNKTLLEADIKTSFFTDQLAFQLLVLGLAFTILLTFIALFSWTKVLVPLKKKILAEHYAEIKKIKTDSFVANSWGLRAMYFTALSYKNKRNALNIALKILVYISRNKESFGKNKYDPTVKRWLGKAIEISNVIDAEDLKNGNFKSINKSLIILIVGLDKIYLKEVNIIQNNVNTKIYSTN
jgi:hypothetical protein